MLSSISAAPLRVAIFFEGEQGQDLAEYSLILAFIAASSVVVLGALMVAITGLLAGITAALP